MSGDTVTWGTPPSTMELAEWKGKEIAEKPGLHFTSCPEVHEKAK